MGLFDEIKRHIKDAMEEAERQTKPRPASPAPVIRQQQPTMALPELDEPAPAEIEHRSLREEIEAEQRARAERHRAQQEQARLHRRNQQKRIQMLHKMLQDPNGLAAAIMAQEVLGPPVSMRKDHLK